MSGVLGLMGARERRSGVPVDALPVLNLHLLRDAGLLSPGAAADLSWPAGLRGTLRAEQGRLWISIEGDAEQAVGLTGFTPGLGGESPCYDLFVDEGRRLRCRQCGGWDHASRHQLRDDAPRIAGRLRGASAAPVR